MKLSLPSNIHRLRKERGMTQEQLAEALGVTFAAVSKWERGAATPELNLIAEMADLFGVSFDALVGFQMQQGGPAALEERMHTLQRDKKYDEAVMEAEKALLRFPNDFRIVYRAGELYSLAGIEGNRPDQIRRSIVLLEHALMLISQNTDPAISEVYLHYEIAQNHIALGNPEKGLEILKKHNVGGVHNAFIAMTCAVQPSIDPKEAEPYLMGSISRIISAAVHTMFAYANYYARMKNYKDSREALLWLIGMLQGLKSTPDSVAYMDKIAAVCYAECAHLSHILGEVQLVETYLHKAYNAAMTFDRAPTYRLDNMKFCVGDTSGTAAYDALGETAFAAIDKQLSQNDKSPELYTLWQQLIAKETDGDRQ
ncbi:MAG: helix-turn-helix transcriptional regulator [Clostridia bacterium]|nr:helix-turn-helix transcriptional regulator [Clostridia bacterium]